MLRITAIIGLQAYAVVLALLHASGGVRTDEAKYLLNIPYPHPPFLRWLMSLFDGFAFQEMFWRIIWATLFIQAVWLVWDMGRKLDRSARLALCACWLLSGGVILYTGSIMLAPINALQGLVLLWFLSRPDLVKKSPVLAGLFWLMSLFSGYQAFLYLPIAVAMFWNIRRSVWDVIVYAFAPVGLLMLYTLSNPLAVASILHHGGEEAVAPIADKLYHTLRLWLIGGSGIVSALGLIGIIKSRRWELFVATMFVFGFVFLNWFEYYSALFVPLMVAGVLILLEKKIIRASWVVVALVPHAIATTMLFPLHLGGSHARMVMAELKKQGLRQSPIAEWTILMHGNFGHEWQYETPLSLRRFRGEFPEQAKALVCLESCPRVPVGWVPVQGMPVEVWVSPR